MAGGSLVLRRLVVVVRRPFRRFASRRAGVGALVAAEVLVALVVGRALLGAGAPIGHPLLVVAATGAFALAGGFTLRLELRRYQVELTLGDAVLVVAFFVLGPLGVALAAAGGELVALAWARVPLDKLAFNVTNRLAAAAVAASVFLVVTGGDHNSVALFAALGAVLCFSLLDVVSTSTVMSLVEGSRPRDQLLAAAPTALLTTLAAAPLGIAAVALAETSLVAPLLLVPLLGAVALNARDGARQRDEHLRFERLYESSVRTARLLELEVSLAAIAQEARTLATGAAAMCVTTAPTSGMCVGVVVDDAGVRPLPDAAMQAVLEAVGDDARERAFDELPGLVPFADPSITTVTLASGPPDTGGRFALAVLRDARSEPADEARVQTLSAFATHGALIAANAWLFAERDEALRHQIDLNRQKSEFVATVSHELRTPLAAMIGSVDTMLRLDDRLPVTDRDTLLRMALDQGGRLQRLIEDLLLVAAAEHTQVRVERGHVEVAALLEDLRLDTVEVARGRVRVALDGPVPSVVTDHAKLLRILRNLVENAAKYTAGGPIEVDAAMRGSELVVSVRDHGPGILAEDRDRVFERFVQLDQTSTRRQGGTGLGLYLSRQLARLLGGRLELESPEDGGCRFVVAVPSFDDERAPRPVAGPTGRGRVLRRPSAVA